MSFESGTVVNTRGGSSRTVSLKLLLKSVTAVVLFVLVVIILLPLITMEFEFGEMMGYGGIMGWDGTASSWWPLVGLLVQLLFLFAVLGGRYLLFRQMTDSQSSHDPTMDELRTAYARGELSDEEFETRQERLERSK